MINTFGYTVAVASCVIFPSNSYFVLFKKFRLCFEF